MGCLKQQLSSGPGFCSGTTVFLFLEKALGVLEVDRSTQGLLNGAYCGRKGNGSSPGDSKIQRTLSVEGTTQNFSAFEESSSK